jgi:hypothetical protein
MLRKGEEWGAEEPNHLRSWTVQEGPRGSFVFEIWVLLNRVLIDTESWCKVFYFIYIVWCVHELMLLLASVCTSWCCLPLRALMVLAAVTCAAGRAGIRAGITEWVEGIRERFVGIWGGSPKYSDDLFHPGIGSRWTEQGHGFVSTLDELCSTIYDQRHNPADS